MTTSLRSAARLQLVRSAVLLASLSALTIACDKKDDAPSASASAVPVAGPSTAPSSAPSATPLPIASVAPNGANTPATDPVATLFGRMADELKNRSPVHPSVDDGFAAFSKVGVAVPNAEQSLGTTYKAAFCRHGVTSGQDLAILLCEYPDEAHAAAGLVEAKKVFPTLQGRHSWARKTLLLTVTVQDHPSKPQAAADEQKVVAAFNAL